AREVFVKAAPAWPHARAERIEHDCHWSKRGSQGRGDGRLKDTDLALKRKMQRSQRGDIVTDEQHAGFVAALSGGSMHAGDQLVLVPRLLDVVPRTELDAFN